MDLTQEQRDYFWARVDKTGGEDACWNWTASAGRYGIVKYNQKTIGTHVLALTLTHGPKPADKPYACHNCKQNKICCNPKHLRWDTHDENMKDRDNDGTTPKGEILGKLTELQVKEIRAKYETGKYTQQKLGEDYGICTAAICQIVNRKTWKHI